MTAMQPSPLANPLATVGQLESSGSQLDGIPVDLSDSIRFAGARLTQAAGILLRLPQEVIAAAIVIFMRFWAGPEGGSVAAVGAQEVSMASLYLAAKLSPFPKSPRSIVNVYACLAAVPGLGSGSGDLAPIGENSDADRFYVTQGRYEREREALFATEQRVLCTLGFQVRVALPYTLCITYLQALDVFAHPRASDLARRAFAHLNTALLSPQCLYLTHQPSALATAAIYLAAREMGVKMPECAWWEVFDADREELGFLCVGMLSVEGFAQAEKSKWEGRKCPLRVVEVEHEVKRRKESALE